MRKIIVLLMLVGVGCAAPQAPKWPLMNAQIVDSVDGEDQVLTTMPGDLTPAVKEACRQVNLERMCGDIPAWRCFFVGLSMKTVYRDKGSILKDVSCMSTLTR